MPPKDKKLDLAINLIISLIIAPPVAFFAALILTWTSIAGIEFGWLILILIYFGIRQPALLLWNTINHVKGVRSDLYIPIRIRRKKFWLGMAVLIATTMLITFLSVSM
jgi:hypothetical protein